MNDEVASRMSNVLQQIKLLKGKYDELAAVTGEHFNVFSILGVETDEVRTHSAFLADLLNPKGSHSQGSAFLKLFLGEICKYSGFDTDQNFESFRVGKEVRTVNYGQIDILLMKNDLCVVIENKIYADDQAGQIKRYYQYARDYGYEDEQIKLVYLTLDGSFPSKESLGNLPKERVIRLSYSEDIINWLEKCMKLQEVQRISPIREIVFQYRDLLKQLTGQLTNRRFSMELKDILVQNENYELIPHLEQAILEFKVHVQYKFWEELKKQILKLPEVRWPETQDQDPSDENIRHFYRGSKNRYVTQTFCLKSVNWNQYDIALSTGTEYARNAEPDIIYFGFILFKNGKRVNRCLDNRFDDLARIFGNVFIRDNNSWLVWKLPEVNVGFPVEYPNQITGILLDDGKRRELVQKFVTEIADSVNQLKENLN